MGVDWDSWNRLKASSVEIILGEKGKILRSFVPKLKITALPCRWAQHLASPRLLWALTLFWLLPCCLAFAKQMCWSLKKTDIMNATVPGFFSYPSRNSMILKTLMLFAHAEAEAWSPGARGDMQGDINGFLPHFCHFVGTWFHSPPLQFHCEAQLWLLESEGVGKIYSQSSSMGCMEGYNQKKTNPGKLQWYWNTWNLAAKGQQFVSTACSIFCGPFGKWPTENWDLKLRWDFRFVSIKSEGTTDLLPPKQVLYHQTSPEICE